MKVFSNKPYELGLRVNGRLECVYEFYTEEQREKFMKENPISDNEKYEKHNKLM